jgi:hypothetical protein
MGAHVDSLNHVFFLDFFVGIWAVQQGSLANATVSFDPFWFDKFGVLISMFCYPELIGSILFMFLEIVLILTNIARN